MDHKQEILLDEFFANKDLWFSNNYMNKICAYIILSTAAFLLLFPDQIWEGDHYCLLLCLYLELLGLESYLRPFRNYKRDDGNIIRIHDIIRYIPISYKQVLLYRWKKLMKLCVRLTGIELLCQVVFSLAFLHTVSPGNILAPLLCGFVLPVSVIVLGDVLFDWLNLLEWLLDRLLMRKRRRAE